MTAGLRRDDEASTVMSAATEWIGPYRLVQQLGDAPFDDVTDADDRLELVVHHDGNVTDAQVGHPARQVLDAVVRGAGLDLAGHDRRDRLVEQGGAHDVQVAHDVALADDPRHGRAVITDHKRTDPVLLQHLEELLNRRVRANGHHQVAFAADHV